MDKVRVYELAKELNTTSKRLIEKLSEIGISVRNHMSLLDEEQLEALYKHIGVIRTGKDTKPEKDDKSIEPARSQKPGFGSERKDIRKGPTIIRKTEIIINSDSTETSRNGLVKGGFSDGSRNDSRRGGKNKKKVRDFVVVADDTSGLRAGFVRESAKDLKALAQRELAKQQEKSMEKKEQEKPVQQDKADIKEPLVQQKGSSDKKPDYKQEQKAEPIHDSEKKKTETSKKRDAGEQIREKTETIKTAHTKQKDTIRTMDNTITKRQETEDISKEHRKDEKDKKQNIQDNKKTVTELHPVKKPLDISEPKYPVVPKEEVSIQRKETKREYQSKDTEKGDKKEGKKDLNKVSNVNKKRKFNTKSVALTGKKQLSEILSEDFILEEFYDDDGVKRSRKTAKPKKEKYIPPKAVLTMVKIPESVTVKTLAEILKKTSTEIIKKLMSMGLMVTLNEEIDFETAAIIADEYGITAEKEVIVSAEDILFDDSEDDEEGLEPRPPVVVVMGHVDHGKTSLLDAIKKTNVTDTEAGGITQHIGAYMVSINGRKITFLDTPGHEAFTAMRARGAQVTDIAILVVAADDGVMPQTVEAINHAKAANVTIIVAINKIDKPGANPDRVKQELTEHGLVAEEWGGDVICVNVSALKRQNIETLLEMVLLSADMLELKANPNKQAKGTVIEAQLDKGRGPVATLIVQRGTLRVGDFIIAGNTAGRIRAMVDDKGRNIKEAGPSTPVEIIGLAEVPEGGQLFYQVEDEKMARQLAEKRKEKQREQQLNTTARVSLDELFNQIQEGHVKELNIIVKADVQGSVEAVKQSLEKLSNDEVRIKIIHGGVGAITEHDVTLAEVSNAIIIGFNVRPSAVVTAAAENAGVDIRLYRIIYNAIEDIEAAMKGMLEPTYKEVVLGHAEIRQIFKVSGVGTIGGCYVIDGKINRNSEVRVVRDGVVVHEGKLESLKRFKDDAKEVAQGFECGLSIERFNDIKEGDIVEAYTMEEVER
ncbi:MAG: translation initiation factor IF-2 [Acetivibrionales bacterium]